MSKNNIIHISDLHISEKNISAIEEILPKLIDDIKENIDGNIDFVICSGDVVYSGIKNNFELAFDKFVLPLIKELGISEKEFICVPGNHEVDLSQIDSDFAKEFTNRILQQGLKKSDIQKKNVKDRLSEFFNYNNLFSQWNQDDLICTNIIAKNGICYGLSCINTAWNTAGDSKNEAKKIIILREELVQSLSKIEKCDKKIIIMHHPIDWFDDDNAAQIEPLLSKYDFVLTGHKHHERSGALLHMNGSTIFNTVSKLEPFDNENGYTIITIDRQFNMVCTNSRTYVQSRLEYAPDIRVSDDGKLHYQVGQPNSIKQTTSDIIVNSRHNFIQSLDKLFITNLLSSNEHKSFDELFVMPIIDTCSDLTANEKQSDRDDFDINEIIANTEDITFWGKKESGKTTLAHYIAKYYYDNYMVTQKLPIIIDCRTMQKYKNAIITTAHKVISELVNSDYSVSKSTIEKVALDGNLVIILDNFDNYGSRRLQVEEFKKQFPNNKCIFFRNAVPAVFSDEDRDCLLENVNENITNHFFIRNLDKHQIRIMAKNLSNLNPSIEDGYVDRIVYSFSTNNMPRTPFAVSLILAICSESSDYMPTNQARIVEAFMEKLLEKLNPSEVLSSTYNFGNKEKFLASVAHEMYSNKKYYITEKQFDEFTLSYHKKKGYDLKDSKFDKIFFEKDILVKYEDKVFFRYECLFYYYLAKYCTSNRKFFYSNILSQDQYLNNGDTISYYAGLTLEDELPIDKIISYTQPYFESHKELGNLFDTDTVKLEILISDDEIRKRIASAKQLPTKEIDEISDRPDNSENFNPLAELPDYSYEENLAFAKSIQLLGDVLRGSEELGVEKKSEAFSIYIKGCVILWKQFRESLLEFAKRINEDLILKKKITDGESYEDIKNALNKAYDYYCDILRLSVPLAISGVIFDCVGTEKLKSIFTDYYNSKDYDDPEKLLLILFICDLKLNSWPELLSDYIKNTHRKDFLWVIFFKCQHYIDFNYFGDRRLQTIKLLYAECGVALKNWNKRQKSVVIDKIDSEHKGKRKRS